MRVSESDIESRVLLLAPTKRDSMVAESLLVRAGALCKVCPDLPVLCQEFAKGAAAILMAEEALIRGKLSLLQNALAAQPPWSDCPVIILTRRSFDSVVAAEALETLGNVTLVERPVRVPTLISAVRTAVRSRQRQYQIRQYLEEREDTEKTLRENDRRKDEFLAMLAHELRNPLSAISNAVQIVKRKDAQEHHPWASNVIEAHVVHLARMIDDLLDVSRITRGKIQLKKQSLDLARVVLSAVETARPFIEERRHHLSVSIAPGPLLAVGDPTRLEQIFVNLLNNAAKYTEPGGKVSVATRRDGNEMIFSVEDNGIGMPRELVINVFELFVQGDRAIARSEGGLGIGLTLVRSLVTMHGGKVWAESSGIGHGSRFSVKLPLTHSSELPAPARTVEDHDNETVRILIVDDNIDAAKSLAQLLELSGHDTYVAYDGPSGLAAAREVKPQVILLDIGLPGMDGYEVAQLLRAEGFRDALIIAVSGYGEEQASKRSRESGFDHYMVKPVDFNSLRGMISAKPPKSMAQGSQ